MQDNAAISKQELRDFEEKLRTEGADGFAAGAHPWEDWDNEGLEPDNSPVWDNSALHHDAQKPAKAGSGSGNRILEGLASLAVAAAVVGTAGIYFANSGDEQQAFSGIQPLPIQRNESTIAEDTSDYRELVAAAPPVSVDLKALQAPAAGEAPQEAAASPAPAAEIAAEEIPAPPTGDSVAAAPELPAVDNVSVTPDSPTADMPAVDDLAVMPDGPAAEMPAPETTLVDTPEPAAPATETSPTGTDTVAAGEPAGADMPAPAVTQPVAEMIETTTDAVVAVEPAETAPPAPAATEIPATEAATTVADEQPAAAAETQTETLARAEPAVVQPPAGEPVEAAARTGNWAINLASYTRESTAEKMLATFIDKGVDAEIFGVSINDKPMYRVRIVGYESFRAAQKEIPALEETLGVNGLWASKR